MEMEEPLRMIFIGPVGVAVVGGGEVVEVLRHLRCKGRVEVAAQAMSTLLSQRTQVLLLLVAQ